MVIVERRWKYIYRNVLGTFAIDEAFEDLRKMDDRKADGLSEISAEDAELVQKVLPLFKKSGFFQEFKKKNTEMTKRKISDSVKPDSLIMQAISSIEDLDKAINVLAKRLREWYGLYLPEAEARIEDNEAFVEFASSGKTREDICRELSIDSTMGGKLGREDIDALVSLAKKIRELVSLRREEKRYLDDLMEKHCPNLKALLGSALAAKLIEHAGSLMKLAELPSSTVQLLGAEKALFRHLKSGAKCPKHGIILQHPLLAEAKKNRGKVARLLADKVSMAAKIDYFKGEFIGDRLKQELEEKVRKLK